MSTYTIKAGPEYDAPWFVAEGDNVQVIKNQIMDFAGFDPKDYADKSLHEVGLEAGSMYQAAWQLVKKAGGRTSTGRGGRGGTTTRTEKPAGAATDADTPPWDTSAPKADGGVIEALNEAKSLDELREVWAKHTDAFTQAEVVAAYKAKKEEIEKALTGEKESK